MSATDRVRPRELRDLLLSQGQSWIRLAEAADILGTTKAGAADAMSRQVGGGLFFSPTPGLYVPLPAQYKSWGALPAADFIDPLMTYLGHSYYVALLSAAELHGAAHQRPQVFQVITNARVRDRDRGRSRLRFHVSPHSGDVPTQHFTVPTGQIRVSTPATTVLDLISRPQLGGGLSNVATVMYELAEDELLTATGWEASARWYPDAALRRAGWLLDHLDAHANQNALLDLLHARRTPGPRVYLNPGAPHRGESRNRWNVVANTEVEPDL